MTKKSDENAEKIELLNKMMAEAMRARHWLQGVVKNANGPISGWNFDQPTMQKWIEMWRGMLMAKYKEHHKFPISKEISPYKAGHK